MLIAAFIYAIFIIFPAKLRLIERVGKDRTYYDIVSLAKNGDLEAAALLKKSRRLLWVALPAACILSLVQSFSSI